MQTALQIYLAIGTLVGIWFYAEMRKWAHIGGRKGSWRLFLITPVAILIWPITAWALANS